MIMMSGRMLMGAGVLGTIEPLLIRRVPNHKIRSTTLVASNARDKIESYESPMYIRIYLKFTLEPRKQLNCIHIYKRMYSFEY